MEMIPLCAWMILMDTLVGILMDFMEFMVGLVQFRGIWKGEYY